MKNQVLNRTEENAITMITHKVMYNDSVYFLTEFLNRNGDLIECTLRDKAGYIVESNREAILEVINEFHKTALVEKV